GRLHPIKGIENLLNAMSLLEDDVRLSICGEGEADYERRLRTMVAELRIESRVTFQGRVDGDAKERQFREADLCIVPSFKENFCMVVAESLAREVPVIASKGTPWKQLDTRGCGICADNDGGELAAAIMQARNMPLREM